MIRVLVGPNRFALQRELQKIKDEFKSQHGNFAVESVDAEEADAGEIRSAVQSVSLFNPAKMVVIKSLGSNKQAAEQIEEIIGSTPEGTQLLIVEPKPDKRSTYYKTLKKRAELSEFAEPDENELVRWLMNEARLLRGQLSSSDARYLASRVGANQGRLYGELRKLIDFDPQISRQNIEKLTEANPQNTIFELLEAAFGGEHEKSMRVYDNLRASSVQPQMILAMLAWQMHQIALVASAGSKTIDQIAVDSGLKPFSLQKAKNITQRLGPTKVKTVLDDLETLDRKMKSVAIDPDSSLKNLLARAATF